LKRASGLIDVFVTIDGNLQYQQNVSILPFGIVVVGAPSNRMQDLAPLIPEMLAFLNAIVRARLDIVLARSRVRHRTAGGNHGEWLPAKV